MAEKPQARARNTVSRALCAAKSGKSLSRCGKKLETKSAAISSEKYTNKYEEIASRFPASSNNWTEANLAEWLALKPAVQKMVGAEIQNQYNARKWPIGSSAGVLKSDGKFSTGKIKRYYLATNGSGMFDAVLLEFSDKTTGVFYFTQLVSA